MLGLFWECDPMMLWPLDSKQLKNNIVQAQKQWYKILITISTKSH